MEHYHKEKIVNKIQHENQKLANTLASKTLKQEKNKANKKKLLQKAISINRKNTHMNSLKIYDCI